MPRRWPTEWQSAAGRLAALAAPVACALQQNTSAWRQRLQGARSGPGKIGIGARNLQLSPLPAPLLRNLVIYLGVKRCSSGDVSGALHMASGFKHGMAYQPPPRALKPLHNETPVPLFARSRLSQFKRGRTRAKMRPRAPLPQSATSKSPCSCLCGRIGRSARARPRMGRVANGGKWGSHYGRRDSSPTTRGGPRQPPTYQESDQ